MISLLGLLLWFTALVAGTNDPATDSLDPPVRLPEKSYRFLAHNGKGAVQFPDKPKESKRTVRIGGISVTLRLATYATVEGDIFLFGYVDLPAEPKHVDAVLQGIHEGLIRDNPTIQQSKLAFGEEKLPGLEVTWSKDDKHMVCRYILHKKRLYQIMVFGSRQFVTSDAARDFLKSLTID
jgi:hypothetical protein